MTQTTASRDFVMAVRRKKGETNVTTKQLAMQTGVSVWTLRDILNSEGGKPTRPSTLAKLNAWLYTQI